MKCLKSKAFLENYITVISKLSLLTSSACSIFQIRNEIYLSKLQYIQTENNLNL